jgi:hypothetical protein
MLLHKHAVQIAHAAGEIHLLLPYDVGGSYLKKCTDPHYTSFGDYWYFWDPYREGCERLQRPELTREVTLNLTFLTAPPKEVAPDFHRWHGDNGNGEKFVVYVMNGLPGPARRLRGARV